MVEVRFDSEGSRAVAYDTEKNLEAGEATVSKSENIWIIDHTEVDDAYGGQGLAAKLVDKVVEEARAKGIKLTATCPYALSRFEKKREELKDVLV